MAKRIGESTADDSHCWIFQKLSMIDDVTKYRYHSISWDGILSSGIS